MPDKSKFIGRMVAAAKAREKNQRTNVSGVRARREKREAEERKGGQVETFVTDGYRRAIREIARGGTACVPSFCIYTCIVPLKCALFTLLQCVYTHACVIMIFLYFALSFPHVFFIFLPEGRYELNECLLTK